MNIKELYPQAYTNIDVCENDALLKPASEWFNQLSVLDQTNATIDYLDNYQKGIRPELLNEYEICHIYSKFLKKRYDEEGW